MSAPAASGYAVAVEGLSALRGYQNIPGDVKRAAVAAVNRTADRARTESARRMREQVAFPASYLAPSGGRLTVSDRARSDSIEARITGRFRPTSLARFAKGGEINRGDTVVEVKPGFARMMRRAFLIRLRAGTADLDTKSNLGLAIRLRPGETIHNKLRVVKMKNGLSLLYGPSVDQVFRSVSGDIAPETADFLESEFNRLIEVGL